MFLLASHLVWKDPKCSQLYNTKSKNRQDWYHVFPNKCLKMRHAVSAYYVSTSRLLVERVPDQLVPPPNTEQQYKKWAERARGQRAGFCLSHKLLLSIAPSSSVVPLPSWLESINILRRGVNVVEVQWSDTRGSAAVIANQPPVLSPAAAAFSWSLISSPFWWLSFFPAFSLTFRLAHSLSCVLSHVNLMNPAQMKCGRALAGPKRSVSRRRDERGEEEKEEELHY